MSKTETKRVLDIEILVAIMRSKQHQGVTVLTRPECGALKEPISPDNGAGFGLSDAMEAAAALVPGAEFKFELDASGNRTNIRVEL
jgi:hypothetical protein